MKLKVEKAYQPINEDLVINPKNCELGILKQYIDVEGNYREIIEKSFQINSPTHTFKGWKDRYEDIFQEKSQTKTPEEPYPTGTRWRTECRLGFYTIESIIQVYGRKLYVISDAGHFGGLFGASADEIDSVMDTLEFNKKLEWD